MNPDRGGCDDCGGAEAEPRGAAAPGGPRCVSSATVLRDECDVIMVHRGQEYRLRVTKEEKLILTK